MPFDTTILSALTKILELDEPESLKGELACALRCLPGTCHASVWGLDDRSKRVFFAFEFLDQPSIKDFSSLCVRQYGEGLIGDVAIHKRDVIYTAASIPGNLMPDTQAAIRNHNIATIAIFAPNAPKDYPCLVVITSTEEIEGDMNRHLGLLKCLFGGFLASYSRAKAKLFENQIHNIIRSKGVSHGIDFLKDACAPIASAFGARSFSIWRIISGTVSPEHFSEPHSVSEYKVGEGITGYVAKTGEPVLLHRVDDAYEMYNVKWVGKASDFNGRKANPGDHLMVVPLNYPKSLQGKAQTNGLIRFVAPFDGPSFWPIDFARACEIGVAISSLLRLDEVLQLETRNNKIHKNLLSLVYTAESSHSIDEVSLSFLTEIEGWPGVVRTDLFQENESGQLEFDEASRLNKNVIEILSGIKWKGQQTPVCIERIWWAVQDSNL